jgi:TetR/AcrR family transcriptional repressor of mexJK operon
MVIEMNSDDVNPAKRRGRSETKRTAMLAAAETLFLADGYERASVDAIAALAGVSKRTIYDHFGDKEQLFTAVVASVTSNLMDALQVAVEEELPEGCDPGPSLLSFVRRVATVTFASSEYVLFRRLLAASGATRNRVMQSQDDPASLLAARIATFGHSGLLNVPKPRRATDHLVALTLHIAIDELEKEDATPAAIDDILIDGIGAFLRAYAPARTAE